MAKKPMKKPGKVVKRAMGGPMGGATPPPMPSQMGLQQMAASPMRPMGQAQMAAAQAAQLAGPGGLRGGSPPPPMQRSAPMRNVPMGAAKAKGGSVKKRPYDAMRDESSRAITAMPYTETKPKAKSKAAPKAPPKRSADWYMRNETSQPGKFAKGGKVYSGTFSEAFRAARKDGVSDFKWAGKKGTTFTTEMAGEKPATKASTPTVKAATAPTPKPGRFSTAPSNRTPAPPKKEEPSFGQANRSAFKTMMAESDRIRSDVTKERAAKTKADNEKYYADREARRQRDNARPAKTVIDLNPFPSKSEAKAARDKATATRNKVAGRPGQALKRGGKVTKRKFI